MHRITESIEINLPAERVFAFLRNIENRMRLNPFYKVFSFVKLTDGDVDVGTRFRIVLLTHDRKSEYESEVVEFVENRKIVTRDSKGRLQLTLTLKETARGAALTHDEEFIIPAEMLYPVESESKSPLWLQALKSIIAMDDVRFYDREKEMRIEEIKRNLTDNLRIWLGRIKETLEAETGKEVYF